MNVNKTLASVIRPSTVIPALILAAAAMFANIAYSDSKQGALAAPDVVTPSATTLPATEVTATEKTKLDCMNIYHLAESIMAVRQSGETLPSLMEKAETSLQEKLIEQAYTHPLYEIAENKDKAINAFAEEAYSGCNIINNRR